MTEAGRKRLDELAKAIFGGSSVDWDLELAAAPESLVPALKRLRQLDGLNRAFRSLPQTGTQPALAIDGASRVESIAKPDPPLFRWGHLDVLAHIGQGSFGDVYLAIDTALERKVALKLWRSNAVAAGASARRFLNEARQLARVCHPNVVVVYGAGVHRRRAGFWTELISGETLATRLDASGPIDAEEATRVGLDICRALAAVHSAGLVHGDVKAENVMRTEDGRIVLMDFGAASRFDSVMGGVGTTPFLTPFAAAPEALAGAAPHPTADFYSLGVLLYRLVSGRYPVSAENLDELRQKHRRGERQPLADARPELPPEFTRMVDQALAVDASARFQNAGEVEGALRAVLRSSAAASARETTQSLRSLRSELGRVPEQLCRRIAREVALALSVLHDTGRGHGRLDLDNVYLLSDGSVTLGTALASGVPVSNMGGSNPARLDAQHGDDLRALGVLLFEAATGSALPKGQPPRRAGELNPQLSSFFEEIIDQLVRNETEPPLSISELAHVLLDGERSAWWRLRARVLRERNRKPLRRILIPRDTSFHGRILELEQLVTAWERAKAGDGRVVLVVGEAGIGKTRLVDELVGHLEQAGENVHFLFGSYPPGGAATTVGAFTDAYREQLGAERLKETLAEYLPDSPLLAAALDALLEGEPSGTDRFAKDTIQTAFVQLTRALAAERPAIVVIDDLHFAPEEGLGIFAALAAAVPGQKLLLVGTARPALPDAWTAAITRLEHVTRIAPVRLSSNHVADLLSELLPSSPVPAAFVEELGARSDGNPFFLLELVRAMQGRTEAPSHCALEQTGRAEIATSMRQIPMPFSIEQLIVARMANLETEEQRELLDVACCAGFRFDATLIAEAARTEPVRALRRFGQIELRHGLVRAAGADYVFDHHQVQEFLYAALADPLKRHYHSALAAAIGARAGISSNPPSEIDGQDLVSVCDHELRGREPERALPLLSRALDHLESHYANASAIALMDHALQVPDLLRGTDRALILFRRGVRLSFVGRRAEAQTTIEEAYELIDPDSDPTLAAEIERNLGIQHRIAGKFDLSVAFLNDAIGHAEAAGHQRSEGLSRRELGTVLFHSGRHGEAEAQYERALELARRAGHREDACLSQSDLGDLLASVGRFADAEGAIRQALAVARELENVEVEIRAVATLGAMLLDLGRLDESQQSFERLLDLSHRIGFRSGESLAWVNLGSLLPALGRYAEARSYFTQVIRIAQEIRTRDHEAFARCNLGLLLGVMGDFEGAEASHSVAETLRVELGFAWLHGDLLLSRGSVAEMRGDLGSAELRFRDALRLFGEEQNSFDTARTLISLGRTTAALGREEEARAHLREAMRVALESGAPSEPVHAAVELALLSEGDLADGIVQLERAELRLVPWERMRVLWRFFVASGDRVHLDAAHAILLELAADIPPEDRQRAIHAVPLYQAILEAEKPMPPYA